MTLGSPGALPRAVGNIPDTSLLGGGGSRVTTTVTASPKMQSANLKSNAHANDSFGTSHLMTADHGRKVIQ